MIPLWKFILKLQNICEYPRKMASLKVYSVGRLARYVTESSLRSYRSNIYRSTAYYSTEEKREPEEKPTLEECRKQIETLSNDLNTLKQQVKDYEDKYKRALADGENVRRRMMKQVEDAKSFAIQSFCKDLLDVADTLGTAAESVPEGEASQSPAALSSLRDGVKMTRAMLTQVFNRHGLQAVSPLREKFDPNLHEALFQQSYVLQFPVKYKEIFLAPDFWPEGIVFRRYREARTNNKIPNNNK